MDSDKVNILIVDDRPEKLLSLEAVLEDLDQNIVRAYSGIEALRLVLKHEFAVILLDINMPGMDGFETAQMIRQRPTSAHVPIIFLTAMSDEMHVARGYSLGAVDYILTPVVPQVLRSKVAVFVDLFKKTRQVQLQAEGLRQRATQLHRLTSASLAVNSAPSVQRIVQIATETARELIGSQHAVMLAFPLHQAHAASHIAQADTGNSARRIVPKFAYDCVRPLICASNKPMRLSQQELETQLPFARNGDGPRLRGLLACPLTARDGRCTGLIYLSDKLSGDFTDDDQAILSQLAQMASVAIENTIYAEERESNRLKDEFLSTLSHELRTPLNAMSGWVQLLKMTETDGEVAHGLDVIERNVKSQTKLIEDLLDLSRVTSGKLRLNARTIQMRSVIESAIDAMTPVVTDKGIELRSQLDIADDASVHGDPERLQQVFWNLLSNAAKFTQRGGKITVSARREGRNLMLAVSDTGDGIEAEFLPQVFDRFRQADSSSSRKHGGLGIGLTIVQHIVGLHGGRVAASSDGKGKGATFTVELPMVLSIGDTADQGDKMSVPPQSLCDLGVLVVDDEPDAREVIATILRRYNAKVVAVSSADEAIQMANEIRPGILVTDLAMPQKDGFQLLRELRGQADGAFANLPAIALTAYARAEDESQALASGFDAHLVKPIDSEKLVKTVHRIAGLNHSPKTVGLSA